MSSKSHRRSTSLENINEGKGKTNIEQGRGQFVKPTTTSYVSALVSPRIVRRKTKTTVYDLSPQLRRGQVQPSYRNNNKPHLPKIALPPTNEKTSVKVKSPVNKGVVIKHADSYSELTWSNHQFSPKCLTTYSPQLEKKSRLTSVLDIKSHTTLPEGSQEFNKVKDKLLSKTLSECDTRDENKNSIECRKNNNDKHNNDKHNDNNGTTSTSTGEQNDRQSCTFKVSKDSTTAFGEQSGSLKQKNKMGDSDRMIFNLSNMPYFEPNIISPPVIRHDNEHHVHWTNDCEVLSVDTKRKPHIEADKVKSSLKKSPVKSILKQDVGAYNT